MRRITRHSMVAVTLVATMALAACSGGGDADDGAADDGATDESVDEGADDTAAEPADDGDGGGDEPVTTEAGGEDTGAATVDRVVWAVQAPIQSMDVAVYADVPTLRAQTAAFDRVLSLDDTGAPQPWIASAFEFVDPLTLVLTIRDDVTFWDGTPLTAEDVAFSIARHVGPESTSFNAFQFAAIASVEVTDPSTVTLELAFPDPGLLAKMAVVAQVHQQQYAEEAGADLGGPDKPGMGTGPYTITSYSSADGVVLTRNADYWAGTPAVEEIEFKVISDPETARLAMDSGEIDGFFDVPLIATRQWDELENATMTYVDGAYNDFLSMDVTRAPFDDVNARQAIAHLIDRDGLLGPLFNGRAAVSTSIVPGSQMVATFGADQPAVLEAIGALPEFSIDLAREALARSATPEGFTVDLAVDTSQPWMSPLAQHLAQNAEQIGITVNVVPVSAADWGAGLFDPEGSPLQLVALGATTPWAGELPAVVLGSTAPFGLAKYGDEEVDALVAEVGAATTVDELRQPLTDLLARANADLPYVPLFDEQVATAISNDITWEGGYGYFAIAQAWPLDLGGAG